MGGQVSRSDFTFSYSDEPHATRRRLILKKYPQIKALMTVDTNFKWQVTALVLIQFASFYLLRNVRGFWTLAGLAYCFGGVINHALMLAVHELSHGMGFGSSRPLANKLLGMFANLPIGLPMCISFKKYHLDHHRYQGDELLDTDVPTFLEAALFRNTALKMLWCMLQPFFYTMRPFFVNPKPLEKLELVNIAIQLSFDYFVYRTLGAHVVYYMLGGSALAMGLHPVAGHFISEHFLFNNTESSKPKVDLNNNNSGRLSHSNGNMRLVRKKPDSTNKLETISELNDCNISEDEQADEPGRDSSKIETTKASIVDTTVGQDGQFLVPETCSYYGPLNMLTFNVGYHVEHHDFPSIPGSKLHKLQEIAPEFYLTLNYHTSWVKVLWRYISDPTVGPSSRVRRPQKLQE